MSTAGNVKIARSERSFYCYINIPTFRIVWSLCNLSLGGKLFLRDDKNTEFVYVHHPLQWHASLNNVTMCVRIRRKSFLIG